LAALTALLALPACGDDASDGDGHNHTHPEGCEAADTFAPNLSKTGRGGVTVTIMEGTPAIPGVNMDNSWSVRVTDDSGAPLEGGRLLMDQDMPEHGHGVPRQAVSTEMGGGVYEIDQVLFTMAGLWVVPIEVSKGSLTDTVEFRFCIGE
jgi:hypothetical protein